MDNRPTAIVVVGHDGSTITSWQASSRRGGSGGGSRWTCVHHPLADHADSGQAIHADETQLAYPLEAGIAYYFVCRDQNGDRVSATLMIYDPADPLGPLALEERTTDAALAAIDLPDPVIGTSPPGDLLVGIPTWLRVDNPWEPISRTAQIGTVAATVTATPTRVDWELGDGSTITCTGPGIAYRAGASTDCSHTYRYRSTVEDPEGRYPLTATIGWNVTYTTSTGPTGDLGTITSAATGSVRVLEAQAVIIYD